MLKSSKSWLPITKYNLTALWPSKPCMPWSPTTSSSSLTHSLSPSAFLHSTSCFLCCCDLVQLFVTPWTAANQASLPFTISWSFLKLTSTELVMPYNHLVLVLTKLISVSGPRNVLCLVPGILTPQRDFQ